jgi:hypothetical protein
VLALRLSTQAGHVELTCDAGSTRHLHEIRSRFTTGSSISGQAFDVELDDLLTNLHELARWPDDDVTWQDELLRLVEANAADAEVVQSRLRATAPADPDARAEEALQALQDRWNAPLTDFQRRDLARMLSLSHAANFSVPGAGKTRVSLAAFEARRASGQVARMLVVCPKSAFESWTTEAAGCFGDQLSVAIVDGAAAPAADVVLINYERLPDLTAALIGWLRAQPSLLVLDEAHRMKLGAAGAWGAACLALGPYATRRMILTGTPAPNGAKDLENLLAFVWPGLGRAAVTNAVAGGDLRRASQALKPLFVRTTKNELQLPPIEIIARRVDLPPLHRELYRALLGQASGRWRGGEQDAEALGRILLYLLMAATTPALLAVGSSRYEPLPYRVPPLQPAPGSTLAELLRDLPQYELSPKYQEVLAIVAANAAAGRKTLVWSTFVRNLTSLHRLLDAFAPTMVHGGIADRADQLDRFRRDPACMVLLSNAATLGEGVSLHHECHDAIYVDRDFAAGRFLQSVDRIHRLGLAPGTETRVTVLVSADTIDEVVELRLAAKLKFMGGILDDSAVLQLGDLDEEPTASAGMDSNDVRALLAHLNTPGSG